MNRFIIVNNNIEILETIKEETFLRDVLHKEGTILKTDKSVQQLVDSGEIVVPERYKLENDNFVYMTEKEQFTAGFITPEQKAEMIANRRKSAYAQESDPLFFKYQREEIEKQVWLDKVAEIKDRIKDLEG
jgi:hypothetical protein